MLLSDIREVVAEKGGDRTTSVDLVAALIAMTDRPWGECNHGKALTQNQLARRLKPYGIRPADMRAGQRVVRGYDHDDFADAFSRYLPDTTAQTATPLQPNNVNKLGKNQSATPIFSVADEKGKFHNIFIDVAAVADETAINVESANAKGQNVPAGGGWRLKI